MHLAHILRLQTEETASWLWRVAANILNKKSPTTDKGQSSSFGVTQGDNNTSLKKPACYKMLHTASELSGLLQTQ
jgi:hypothetical protein